MNTVADAIIAATLEWEVCEFEETVAGIQRGLQVVDEGREWPFDEYVADVKAERRVTTRNCVQEV